MELSLMVIYHVTTYLES